MRKESGTDSYYITKDEIIEKFGIIVADSEDTWSYYRDNVLEIKVVPRPKPVKHGKKKEKA